MSAEPHDNADSDGEDADGFAAKLTVGSGNIFRYAVSHNNIDDGWDLYTKTDTGPIGVVTIEDSLAYNNGTLSNGGQAGNGDRNGYKLGGEDIPVNHVVRRSIAYRNGKHGFTYNSNPGTMTVSNNVSIDNAERNFNFDGGSSVFRNNISCRSGSSTNDRIIGDADSSNQFWSGSNGSRCSSYTGALGWSFALRRPPRRDLRRQSGNAVTDPAARASPLAGTFPTWRTDSAGAAASMPSPPSGCGAWSSSASTATGTAPWHCARSCSRRTGLTWTGTRRR
ncbi:hypothetical protein [Micromonospora sp. MH33]|uniref:hypothetical protein n=1 Tax=Micromonospora sp. MH33 TaxID=1945509 RepID=UPI001FEDCC01|nr:hypothetical protein [Micromonospora sp. MH33]